MSEKWFEGDYPENFDKIPPEAQQALLAWIDRNLYPIKSFNNKHTSYGLKHQYNLAYVDNGTFKGAMLKAGFKVKNYSEQNWVFNISERSPLFLSREK